MKSNLDTKLVALYSSENITINIKSANSSINKRDRKHLNQALNRLEVERRDKVKIAKGDIRIKTLSKIYLIEYIKVRLRKPTDTIVLIIPSIEKMLEEFSSTNIIELDTSISLEKQISACKRL